MEPPTLKVVEMLLQDGASVHAFFPMAERGVAMAECYNMEIDDTRLVFCGTPWDAVESAHAIAVLTEYPKHPYPEFYSAMMKPAFLFDGCGVLNHRELEAVGFYVHAVGTER